MEGFAFSFVLFCFVLFPLIPPPSHPKKVVLIDGAGNAPPEDSNGLKSKGCSDFYDLYDEVVKLKKRGRPPTGKLLSNLREARGSANFCTSMSGSGFLLLVVFIFVVCFVVLLFCCLLFVVFVCFCSLLLFFVFVVIVIFQFYLFYSLF